MPEKSALEKVFEALPDHVHQSPFPLNENPFSQEYYLNIAECAILKYSKHKDITDFMEQFILYIKEKFPLSRQDAEKAANESVGYATGYVDDKRANIWFDALPDISHPIMGRERPFMNDAHSKMYYFIAETDDPEVKAYLIKEVMSLLGRGGDLEVTPLINGPHCTLSVRVTNDTGFYKNASNAFMYLSGICVGIISRMEAEIGKKCEMHVEVLKGIQ